MQPMTGENRTATGAKFPCVPSTTVTTARSDPWPSAGTGAFVTCKSKPESAACGSQSAPATSGRDRLSVARPSR